MQEKILAAIIDYKRKTDGNSPSYSEIAVMTNVSRTWAWHIVRSLIDAGKLETIEGRVCVVGGHWEIRYPVGGSRR